MIDTTTTSISITVSTSVDEIKTIKTLLKITDIFGREINPYTNTQLFYIYDDGTIEKRITLE